MYTQTAFPVIDLKGTGRNIDRYRCQAELTVRDLQTYFGFEYPQAIYKWQRGECLPTVDNLLALAKLLRVSMEDLLVYHDQEVSPFSRFRHRTAHALPPRNGRGARPDPNERSGEPWSRIKSIPLRRTWPIASAPRVRAARS